MTAHLVKCPSCGEQIEEDSAYCRHCGQRVPQGPTDLQAILNRTAASDINTALGAIEEYFRRWPDGPEARDLRITSECIRLELSFFKIYKGGFTGNYVEVELLADSCADGLPSSLVNGLVTSARVRDVTKRKGIIDAITALDAAFGAVLRIHYDAAHKECQSLLVNGQSQAKIKGVSRESAVQDAEVHWSAFQNGELEAAMRGFTYLKELNPMEPFFRQARGSVLFAQEKWLDALREFLYGLSLAPGDADLTANTLRCVCGLSLYPAALGIVRHYESVGRDLQDRRIRGWGVLARAVVTALAARTASCTAEDLSEDEKDAVDEVAEPESPWLTKPSTSDKADDVLGNARAFISYRHSGGMDFARHLERALKGSHPSMRVFRDETWIRPGHDFVDELREEIDRTDVFLALIDRNWAQRFQDPSDPLRREVARALRNSTKIIPVLLEDVSMPRESDLPAELSEFVRLDAVRLTKSGLAEDLVLLDVEMADALKEVRRQERMVGNEIAKVVKLKEQDPEAADRIIKRWADVFPKFIPGKSEHGEGVPEENVELGGLWECTAPILKVRLKLTFMLEDTDERPFAGEYCVSPGGLMSFWKIRREEIKGTWMPVVDVEKKLLLGLALDGLQSGKPFKLTIPIHRRLGHGFVGTDTQGITYSSSNVQPKREGL